jgi:hypothetical protein
MKKTMAIFLALMLALAGTAFASVQLYQDGAELGHVNQLNCSTGTTCTKVGDRVDVVTAVGTAADIRSGSIYGVTTLAFNGAADALNTWKGIANGITFEGATADAHETTLDVADPTADVTYRLPVVGAGTYSLMSSTLATNAPGIANSVSGGTNQLIFEGATADDYETIITPTDATADRTITLPNASGTVGLRVASATALTAGAAITLTVTSGEQYYTLTSTDNEDSTITFSGAGAFGDTVTILVTTAGTADEVLTFHATLVSSPGTLTAGTTAGKFYTIKFFSNGSHWYELSRTAVQT